jgi:hypothetical protein
MDCGVMVTQLILVQLFWVRVPAVHHEYNNRNNIKNFIKSIFFLQ